jgi:hypothetical protein
MIEQRTPIPLRKGAIDLTWLAGRIGATRQIFYPGRGSPEVLQLLALLNQYLEGKSGAATNAPNSDVQQSRLQVELILAKEENLKLKQQLRKARHDLDMMHSGGIILCESK